MRESAGTGTGPITDIEVNSAKSPKSVSLSEVTLDEKEGRCWLVCGGWLGWISSPRRSLRALYLSLDEREGDFSANIAGSFSSYGGLVAFHDILLVMAVSVSVGGTRVEVCIDGPVKSPKSSSLSSLDAGCNLD